MPPFRFYLITDHQHTRHKPPDVLPDLVEAGLRALQVREKGLSPAALAAYCQTLLAGIGPRREALSLYLNDRAELALSLGFEGVHLRADSLPLHLQAPSLRATLGFGVSTHTLAGVQAAASAGAAFATFGPVYATPSKADYGAPVGLRALEAAAAIGLPLFALGGVTPERCGECLSVGAVGVAAISAVWDAEHPGQALERFREALGGL